MSTPAPDTATAASVLRKLHPVIELTVTVRPLLLLVADASRAGPLLLGMLYHRQAGTCQTWLRFRLPGQGEFLRRTKWRRCSYPRGIRRRQRKITADFAALATAVDGAVTARLEFSATASDEEIVRAILASPIAALLA